MDVVFMKRVGIYFKLKEGALGGYKEAHEDIEPKMRAILDEAGICNYSIWNLGEKLFAYYEVEDEEKMQEILSSSRVYGQWRDRMENFVYKEEKTGTKEWPMEMVFFHQGE